MSNGQSTETAETTETTEELYDSLSQEGQDQWDAIGVLGYTPEKGAAGLWFARKPGTEAKDAIGPSDSLTVLVTMVNEFVAKYPPSDYETPASTRLPGMEEPAIEELDKQADLCIAAFEKKKSAAAASKDEDDIMRNKMHDLGRKRYTRYGWSLVIEDSEKLVVKKAENGPKQRMKKSKKSTDDDD